MSTDEKPADPAPSAGEGTSVGSASGVADARAVVQWSRVSVHALTALIVGAVLSSVVALTFASMPPYEAGRIAGGVGMTAMVAAGVASYLAQSRARWFVIVAGTLAAIAVGAGVSFKQSHRLDLRARDSSTPSPSQFTDADRAPLVEDISPPRPARLRHPTFGFSFLEPTGLVESPRVARGLAGMNAVASYGYENNASHSILIVAVMSAPNGDSDTLGHNLDEFLRGAIDTTHVTVTDRAVSAGEAHADAELPGVHFRVSLRAVDTGRGWIHVMMMTGARDPAALVDVLNSFQP
jgi:hypothetical protein